MSPKKSEGRKKRSAEEKKVEVANIPQPPSSADEQNEAIKEYSEQPAEPLYDGGCSEDDGEEDYLKQKSHSYSQQWNSSWQISTKGALFFITKVEATLKTRRRSVCCKSRLQHQTQLVSVVC